MTKSLAAINVGKVKYLLAVYGCFRLISHNFPRNYGPSIHNFTPHKPKSHLRGPAGSIHSTIECILKKSQKKKIENTIKRRVRAVKSCHF